MAHPALYSIDTSVLIHGWVRRYPPSVRMFTPVWDQLDRLIHDGVIRASEEVLEDLRKQEGDELLAWCEERPDFFVPIDDPTQDTMNSIMGEYPRLVDTVKGKSASDPWVISLALRYNPKLAVVTEENGGSENKPNIPYVCLQKDIRCINFLDRIKETA